MCIMNLFPLMAVVPIALLLTLSFFVLLTLRKVEEKGLKAFGYVVVSFIWLAALVVFSGAVYRTAKGTMMSKYMHGQKMGMQQREQKDNMPGMNMPGMDMSSMAMPEKSAAIKDAKHSGMPKCGGNKGLFMKKDKDGQI